MNVLNVFPGATYDAALYFVENLLLGSNLDGMRVASFGALVGLVERVHGLFFLHVTNLDQKLARLSLRIKDVQQIYLSKFSDKKTWKEIDWNQIDPNDKTINRMTDEYCPLFKEGYSIFRRTRFFEVALGITTRIVVNALKPQIRNNPMYLPWRDLALLTVSHYFMFGVYELTKHELNSHTVFWSNKCC